MIDSFKGDYCFLSNFYEAKVTYEGITYLNNEAAFQSIKANFLFLFLLKKGGLNVRMEYD